MAESSILTTWGATYPGRETMGLGIFQEVIQYYETAKAEGRIAEFRVGITELGNIGDLSGYMLAEGTAGQVQTLLADAGFKKLLAKATHVVPFSVVSCATGTAIPSSVERLLTARGELGIG